jgi:hypothetical protein
MGTRTGHKATNLSNVITPLNDRSYSQNLTVCRYCDLVADTADKARGICPVTGKRHFLVSR